MKQSTDMKMYEDRKHWYASGPQHLHFTPSLPHISHSCGTISQGLRGNGFVFNNEEEVNLAKVEALLAVRKEAEAGLKRINEVLAAVEAELTRLSPQTDN